MLESCYKDLERTGLPDDIGPKYPSQFRIASKAVDNFVIDEFFFQQKFKRLI
jgi:DNA polymerase II small subunit/DNA polymerase delta subunit B